MAKLDSDYSWSAALVLIIFSSALFEAIWVVFFWFTVRDTSLPSLIMLFIDFTGNVRIIVSLAIVPRNYSRISLTFCPSYSPFLRVFPVSFLIDLRIFFC